MSSFAFVCMRNQTPAATAKKKVAIAIARNSRRRRFGRRCVDAVTVWAVTVGALGIDCVVDPLPAMRALARLLRRLEPGLVVAAISVVSTSGPSVVNGTTFAF